MSMNVGSEGDMMVEMNTTPLIDVMLVLLIMFIITIPIQTHAVKLNMPTPSNVQPTKLPEVMRVDVDFDGATCACRVGEMIGDGYHSLSSGKKTEARRP